MNPDRVVAAARALVHLWQNEAETALISLEVWPALGEAIDELADSFAPMPAKPGMAVPVNELQPGDVVRYPAGPFEPGVDAWTVREIRADESRPAGTSWRLVVDRVAEGVREQRAGDHATHDTVTLMYRPSGQTRTPPVSGAVPPHRSDQPQCS